jgi:hypothetical protein
MHCDSVDYALRLFLKNIDDQAQRYARISEFVQHDNLPYTVTFDFLQKGIKVHGDWFPALKMEWLEGITFEEYIVANLKNPAALAELGNSFVQMMSAMRVAGIAHGDLQHGNIIMCGNEIRLVDYDGMFVPAMKNFSACEIGHPNYQHPGRTAVHFGPYLDNFSAWIIYSSIKALEIDSSLLHQLGGGDDCLLFRRSDFLQPLQSPVFAALERHDDKLLRSLGRFVRAQLTCSVEKIPYLALPVPDCISQLDSLPKSVSEFRNGPRVIHENVAEWVRASNLEALSKSEEARSRFSEERSTLFHPQNVQAQSSNAWSWIKPVPSHSKNTIYSGAQSDAQPALLIPPELIVNAPRKVALVKSSKYISPIFKQWLMLFCPLVWMMGYLFFTAYTVDLDLKNNGKAYDATIYKVDRYQTSSKNGPISHTDVAAAYMVHGQTYHVVRDMGPDNGYFKKGDVYPVVALPDNPGVHEDFNAKAGSRQQNDLAGAWCLFLLNCLLETMIWFIPYKHKILASSGNPVVGTVTNLVTNLSRTSGTFIANVSYVVASKSYKAEIRVSRAEYAQLKVGSQEILLCDPHDMNSPIFYKFSRYHALPPSAAQPNLP